MADLLKTLVLVNAQRTFDVRSGERTVWVTLESEDKAPGIDGPAPKVRVTFAASEVTAAQLERLKTMDVAMLNVPGVEEPEGLQEQEQPKTVAAAPAAPSKLKVTKTAAAPAPSTEVKPEGQDTAAGTGTSEGMGDGNVKLDPLPDGSETKI